MLEELMEETGWAEYWRREGHRRGVQEGVQEGRQEGLLEGERRMLGIMLEARFGALADDVATALASADEDTLRSAAEHASRDTLDQVRQRLGLG